MRIKQSPLGLSQRPVPSHDPFREHWDVTNIGTEKQPILELQCNRTGEGTVEIDENHGAPRIFPNDSAAMVYVMQRACRDACPDARNAVIEIVKSWGYKVTAQRTNIA